MHKENDIFGILAPNTGMTRFDIHELNLPFCLKAHRAVNLLIDSPSLQSNPLGDPSKRHNYVLLPAGEMKNLPIIFHLSGYFSTGHQSFQVKTLNHNFVEKIDEGVLKGEYPKAIHVFVEATSYWGGSQFINSVGCGNYADYILKDLYPCVVEAFGANQEARYSCVMGGSSGGYGALSLISELKSPFGIALAVAPDSFFEASLLPEIFQAIPELSKYKSFTKIKKLIDDGEIQEKRSFFTLANVIAMAHCYAPQTSIKKDFIDFPVDLYTGEVDHKLWKQWLKNDPIHFLKKRKKRLEKKEIYLDVGKYDNFSLQFGTRQIAQQLKIQKVKHHYSEFSGNHFGLSQRRLLFLGQLAKKWRKFV